MVLIDNMIRGRRFAEFVSEFVGILNEEVKEQADLELAHLRWDFWLHRVFDMGYDEYLSLVKDQTEQQETPSNTNLEETVKESMEIIKGFSLS